MTFIINKDSIFLLIDHNNKGSSKHRDSDTSVTTYLSWIGG